MSVDSCNKEGQYDYIAPLCLPSKEGRQTSSTFDFIVGEYYRSLMANCVNRLVDLNLVSSRLGANIAADIQSCSIDMDYAWHFSRGFFEEAIRDDRIQMSVRGMDQLFIHLAAHSGHVKRKLESVGELLYFGHSWFGTGADLSDVCGQGNAVVLFDKRGECLALGAGFDRSATPGFAHIRQILTIEVAGRRVAFHSREDIDPECLENISNPVVSRTDEILSRWIDALELIRSVSVPYFEWCVHAVRHVIPIEHPPEAMLSGSQGQFPGQVYMSADLEPIQLAEMIIHEASHQYYQAIEWLGPVSDRDAGEMFFSPVVGRDRPVDRVLLAYHAFVNVYAFMQMCSRQGLSENGFIERNSERVAEELRILAAGLNAASSLTPIGRRFWNELKTVAL